MYYKMDNYKRLWCKLCDSRNEHKIRRFLSKSIQHDIDISSNIIDNVLSSIPISEMIDKNLIQQRHQGNCDAILTVPEKLANHPYFNQEIYRLLLGREALKHIASLMGKDQLSCMDLLLLQGSMSTDDFTLLNEYPEYNRNFWIK